VEQLYRHLRDLKEGPKRGLKWDLDAVTRILGFFPDVLKLAGGQFEGRVFILAPSQQFILGSLFGWKRSDGMRRYRRAYIEQAKGNGKYYIIDVVNLDQALEWAARCPATGYGAVEVRPCVPMG